jgi:excisionase family DNA binding protein
MSTHMLTSREAAQYLRLRPSTVARKARTGQIQGSKVGGEWRFARRDLDYWLRNGGLDHYEKLVDEGLVDLAVERMAQPDHEWLSLEEVRRTLDL